MIPALMCAIPDVMTQRSSDSVMVLRYGRTVQGRLRLSHEHAGGGVEALRAARPHEAGRDAREQRHHHLHDAEVVEDREQGGHEDDGGQHLEREDEPDAAAPRLAQRPEHELRALERQGEERADLLSQPAEDPLADGDLQDEQGQRELEAQAPGHGLEADGAPVGGEGPGSGQDGQQADDGKEPLHQKAARSIVTRGSGKEIPR